MEEVVEPGVLKPSEIHVPGIFVQRIIQGGKYDKRIERRMTRGSSDAGASAVDPVRERIIKRAAQELEVGQPLCSHAWVVFTPALPAHRR